MTIAALCGALLLWVGLPAIAVGMLTAPKVDDAWSFIGRAVAAGFSVWLLATQLLATSIGLTSTTAWITSGLIGVTSLFLIISGRRWRRRPSWTGLGAAAAAVAVGLVAWAPVFIVSVEEPDALLQPTPWYYWNLAEQVADAGEIPASSFEWGTSTEFLADYPGFTSATAALIVQTHDAGLAPARAVMVLAAVGALVGLGVVVVALGGRTVGAAVALPLFIALDVFSTKLSSYRPEALGYGLMLLCGGLALLWLRHRQRGALLAGALAFVALGQVHGIDLVVAAVFVVAAGACAVAVGGAKRGRVARRVLPLAAWPAVWSAWTIILTGRLTGFAQVGGIADQGGLADPTWEFVSAIAGLPMSMPPGPADLARQSLERGFVGTKPLVIAVVAVGLAVFAAVASRWAREREDRRLAARCLVFSAVTLLGILAVCMWFDVRWDSYVPRRTGFGRTLQLVTLLVPVGAGALASLGWARRALVAVGCAGAVTVTAVAWTTQPDRLSEQRPGEEVLAAFERLDLPDDGLVLTSTYTEGFVPGAIGPYGLLDGRAPYTYPELLDRATRLLRESAAFFADPVGQAEMLSANHVTHVIVVPPGSWSLGTPARFPVNLEALGQLPELRRIGEFADVVVFAVEPGATSGPG